MKNIVARSELFLTGLLTFAIIFSHAIFPFVGKIAAQANKNAVAEKETNLVSHLAAIEKQIEKRRVETGVPGLSLAIIKDDSVIFEKGFGLRDVENNLPATPETIFAAGSTTKAFTAMLAAIAADEDKLSLEDSPKKYLPYFKLRDKEADEKITIRDLLTHRSGLNRTDLAMLSPVFSREEIIRVASDAKPTAPFRAKWQYQNVMYAAAGEATARAFDSSWEKLLREKILKPLGMKESNVSVKEMQASENCAVGYSYDWDTKKLSRKRLIDLKSPAPAGALNSNAREMIRWVRLMVNRGKIGGKELVSEKNFAELVKPQIPIAPGMSYGLGWFIGDWKGKKTVYHGGNIDGFHSMVAFIPEENIGFVLLSNVSYTPLADEAREIIWSNLLEKKSQTPVTENKIQQTSDSKNSPSLADLQREVGRYHFAQADAVFEIALKDGKLHLIAPGQPVLALEHLEGRQYRLAPPAPDGIFLTFRAESGEKASEILFEQPQGKVVLKRIADEEKPPVEIEELMANIIKAAGGEENLRKHDTLVMKSLTVFENEGVTADSISYSKAPNKRSERHKLIALGKNFGEIFDYFDGTRGGTVISFGTPEEKTGKALAAMRLNADFYQPLNWRKNYPQIEFTRTAKIGEEEVYVIKKTPAEGYPVTEYISAKTFLVLRQDTEIPYAANLTIPQTTQFSDYREVDGVMIPFKYTTKNPITGEVVTTVKEVRFDVEISDAVFSLEKSNSKNSQTVNTIGSKLKTQSEQLSKTDDANPFSVYNENLKKGNYLTPLIELQNEEYMQSKFGAVVPDLLAYLHSFTGEYSKAYEFLDKGRNLDSPAYKQLEKSPIDEYEPKNAVDAIAKLAENQQVIMINEEHDTPLHRAFTMRLLPVLYEKGFRYFAAETFNEADKELNLRGFPVMKTGEYSKDPVFGNMIRTAAKLGYKLVPYEQAMKDLADCKPEPDNPMSCQNEREKAQAQNLYERILKNDPKAKVLVHVGRGHNQQINLGKWALMGWHFKEITGITPLSVNQMLSERSAPKYEMGLYRYVAGKWDFDEPTVFQNRNGKYFDTIGFNLAVFHPRSRYENGRPTWLKTYGREAVDIFKTDKKLKKIILKSELPLLIQAYFANEPEDAIPVDQIILQDKKQVPFLILPKEIFRLRVTAADGKIIRQQSFAVK